MEISQHNLDRILFCMEGVGWKKHELTDQCQYCQETVSQRDNICPGCSAHVIWLESPTWKRLYGKPSEYLLVLTGDKLKGKTPLQVTVISAYGSNGRFRTKTQQAEFLRVEKKYPDAFIKHVLEWAVNKRVPWRSFIGGIKNESWLERWTEEEIGGLSDEEQRPGISSEELSRMLS